MSSNLDSIRNILKQSNIFYTENNNLIHTFWKDKKDHEIDIVLFSENGWLNFLSILDMKRINNQSTNFSHDLLKFNSKYIGLKFCLDKNDRFLVLYQIPFSVVVSDILKPIFQQFMQVINDLYQ
jgi:hypothetical protein